jgi:hypothetical protein
VSLRDQILNSNDRKTAKVETPEWGCGHVHIRTLSHAERNRLNARIQKMRGTPEESDAGGLMAATVICDEQGNRVFDDADAKALAEKSGAVLDRIVEEWRRLNALTPDEVKAVEKNSSTPPNSN